MGVLRSLAFAFAHCAGCASATQVFHSTRNVAPRSIRNATSVTVELYYETLCPFSLSWLNYTFREVWEDPELRDRMDVRLYPFGNAAFVEKGQVSAGYQFWHEDALYPLIQCQHGDNECFGNEVQACAINRLGKELSVSFILCMSAYGTNYGLELTSFACGSKLGIDMAEIKACVFSSASHAMMASLGKKSLDPALGRDYVPWVVVNGVHSEQAEENLVAALCSSLSTPLPAACGYKVAEDFTPALSFSDADPKEMFVGSRNDGAEQGTGFRTLGRSPRNTIRPPLLLAEVTPSGVHGRSLPRVADRTLAGAGGGSSGSAFWKV